MREPDLDVVIAPAPFQPRVERLTVQPGATVAEILLRACLDGVLDPQDLPRTEVDIDGVRLKDRDAAADIVPPAGSIVNLTVQVYGGRGGNKALQTVLQVAILVAAFAVAGPAGSAGAFAVNGFGAATALGSAAGVAASVAAVSAVELAGTALMSALTPGASSSSAAQAYALETQSNQSRLRASMPLCLGRRRWAFDLASSAFTTFSGDDMWITAIYGLHYGPCTLTDIKIGETLLTAYPAGEVQTETFLAPGPRNSALYPTDIHQDSFQNTLDRAHGNYALATTVDDATSIELDFYWAGGLYYPKADGRNVESDTKITIEISPYGANAWQPAPGLAAGVDKSGNAYPAGTYYVRAASKDPVRKTVHIALPAQGKWDLRVHRDIRAADDTNQDTVTWTALRAPRPGKPVLDETLSLLVLKVKASQDFSGSLGVVTGIVTPIVPVPGNDKSWSTTAATSNAAALARWLMTGPAAAQPLAAGEVDASCADQFALIEANGWGASVLVTDGSQQDALNKLAAAGRFQVFWSGAALTFSPDWIKPAARQLFAGRNAQNYARRRTYPDPVHAVWVEFVNSAADDKQDGLIVYNDGFDGTNATLVEALSLEFGCTPDRAHREGRTWLARRKLQVWVHEWIAFVDGVACSRGDRVRARRSSALYGMVDARVAFRRWGAGALVSGVRLDTEVRMEAGKAYALDVRRPDGLVLNLALTTTPGRVRDVVFAAPQPVAGSPGKGDLVAFGAVGQITEDVEIVDLDPRADGTVTVRGVNYIGPDLVAAETGPIPPLETFLSLRVAAPQPRILSISGDPDSVVVGFDVPPQRTAGLSAFSVRYTRTLTPDVTGASWKSLSRLPPSAREARTPAIEAAANLADDPNGRVYVTVEIRSYTTLGEVSPPARAQVEVTRAVPAPTNFQATVHLRVGTDGSSYPAIEISADPVAAGLVQFLIVEVRPHGGTDADWKAAQPFQAKNPQGDITGFMAGSTVDLRAAFQTVDNWLSPWVEADGLLIAEGAHVSAFTGGTPANSCTDTDFYFAAAVWGDLYNSTGQTVTQDVYELSGLRALRRTASGHPPANTALNVGQGGSPALIKAIGLPVHSGQRIEASAYFAASAVYQVRCFVSWYDVAGNFVSSSQVGDPITNPVGSGTHGLDSFPRTGGFAVAPQAGFAVISSNGVTNGDQNYPAYLVMLKPLLSPARTEQTELSDWVPGRLLNQNADVTGLNIAAGVTGQGPLATATTVTGAVIAAAAAGGNACLDTSFYYPSLYWVGVGGDGGSTVTSSVVTYTGMRALKGQYAAAVNAGGKYLNVGQSGPNQATWALPVQPGQRIEAQAYVAAVAMVSCAVIVQFLDKNLAVLAAPQVGLTTNLLGSGNNGLASLVQVGGITPAAPANTAFAIFIVQGLTNGDPSNPPSVAVCKPLLKIAGAAQTELSTYSPGVEAQPGSDITILNTSAGITGQGALATQSVATVGANTTTQPGFIRDVNGNVLTLGDLKTILGTSAGITGQGGLATKDDAVWGTDFINMPQWSTDTTVRPGYGTPALKADFLVYVAGNVAVSSLKPGEAGANITENRNASGISGQGALATMGSIPYGTTYISSLPLAIQVGQGLFGNGTIGAFYIRLNGTDPFGVNYILQHMDYTGRIVAGSGLPTATSAGYGVVFNPASPMSSPNSSTISISATTIYMPGNITLNAPSGSYGGLAADTDYLGAYNQVNNVTGINPGNDNTFLTDPAKFICYGTQRTQMSSGGFSARPYSGGGGKNDCPDPAMLVQMANPSLDGPGEIVRADAVRAGDWVWTRHEETLEWGAYEVTVAELAWSDDRCSLDLGGSEPWVGSAGHRWFAERREWTATRDLRPGDRLLGPSVVAGRVQAAAAGDVVKITVAEAHTYVCGPTADRLALCHNLKRLST